MICKNCFPGGLRKAVTFSFDDGVRQDLRLMDLFRTHGIKATFNLNSGLFGQEGVVAAGKKEVPTPRRVLPFWPEQANLTIKIWI